MARGRTPVRFGLRYGAIRTSVAIAAAIVVLGVPSSFPLPAVAGLTLRPGHLASPSTVQLAGRSFSPVASLSPSATQGALVWADVHPPKGAPSLFYPDLAYDAYDGYLVLFGGCGGVLCSSPSNQTWIYANGSWSQLSLPLAPPGREEAMMAYDAAAGYVLLYGGRGAAGTLSDTWAYRSGVWQQLTPVASPGPRSYGSMVYDTADAEVVLFGGYVCFTGCGTWVFANDNWTELNISNPPWRYGAGMAYDPGLGEAVLFGGVGNGGGYFSDTWTFRQGVWSGVSSVGPPLRSDPEMSYDGASGQVVLFGGQYVTLSNFPGVSYSDTWSFGGGGWQKLTPSASPPSLSEGALAEDGPASYAVEVGGCGPSACPSGETWVVGPTASVTVRTAPAACGTVTIAGSPRSDRTAAILPLGSYSALATPCAHYIFASLAGSAGVTAEGLAPSFSVAADGTLTARFAPVNYSVVFAISPATCGTVSVNGSVVPLGTAVGLLYGWHNVSASGCSGMSLSGWAVDGTNLTLPEGSGSPTVLNVSGNGTVTAQFSSTSTNPLGSIGGLPVLDVLLVVVAVLAAIGAVVLLRRRRSRPSESPVDEPLPTPDEGDEMKDGPA